MFICACAWLANNTVDFPSVRDNKHKTFCLSYLLICIHVKNPSHFRVNATFIGWIFQCALWTAGLNLRSKRMHWAKQTTHHTGGGKKGTELILGRRLITALLLGFGIDFAPKWTPSALRALNPQWHTTRNDEEPDQTCQRGPQGCSQPLHILWKLKCDPVLFFSSLSDRVWCGDVNSEGKLLSPF